MGQDRCQIINIPARLANKKKQHISTLGSRLTSVISVTLVLLVLGILAFVTIAADSASRAVKENMTMIVKLEPDASKDDINTAKHRLLTGPFVASHIYRSAEIVLAEEMPYLGEETVEALDENPFGAEFEITLKPDYANADSLTALQQRLSNLPALDRIITNVAVAKTIDNTVHNLTWVFLGVAAALLVISLVLINNTVSLSIYSRRFIIHTMKLVGATPSFIRRPFLRAGMTIGLVSGIAASALLTAGYFYLRTLDPAIAASITPTWCITVYVGLTILGVLVCGITSMWSANRYIRKNFDQLFKK
jgi:cell division transport system permease protein